MPHRNPLNLDSKDNTAIRKEIGDQLRVLLSKEQPSLSPRVQRMSNDDEYRQQAEHAEHQARRAISNIDREAWLRVAQGWRSLLRKRSQSDDESPK